MRRLLFVVLVGAMWCIAVRGGAEAARAQVVAGCTPQAMVINGAALADVTLPALPWPPSTTYQTVTSTVEFQVQVPASWQPVALPALTTDVRARREASSDGAQDLIVTPLTNGQGALAAVEATTQGYDRLTNYAVYAGPPCTIGVPGACADALDVLSYRSDQGAETLRFVLVALGNSEFSFVLTMPADAVRRAPDVPVQIISSFALIGFGSGCSSGANGCGGCVAPSIMPTTPVN